MASLRCSFCGLFRKRLYLRDDSPLCSGCVLVHLTKEGIIQKLEGKDGR